MRTIDKFYDSIRHELFESTPEQRKIFAKRGRYGELNSVRCAAEIVEAWNEVFRDDFYPIDYWAEKWILLKRIAVGKRKRDNLDHIVDGCLLLIRNKCKRTIFSNEPYENNLVKWSF